MERKHITEPGSVKAYQQDLTQIAEIARKHQGEALTNLQQFIDEPMLADGFAKLNNGSSPRVDRITQCQATRSLQLLWDHIQQLKYRQIPQGSRAHPS